MNREQLAATADPGMFAVYASGEMDGPDIARNTEMVTAYCDAHSQWKVSLQTHKILGIP